jgi:putative phage-type endonuclease
METPCKKVLALLKKPQFAQRTPEWFLARKEKITASEAASCLFKDENTCSEYVKYFNIKNFKYDNKGVNPYENLNQYIIKKCEEFIPFTDTPHTIWGKKYEDSALRLYKLLTKKHVLEFGLLPHYRNKWLAASPDGITTDGIMLEIKCPMSRKILAGYMPFYYYTQVQIQLEVCNLDECHFLECKMVETTFDKFFNQDKELDEYDGVIVMNKLTGIYTYPDINILTKNDFVEWLKNFDCNDYEYTCYRIEQYNLITVERSKIWFNNIKPTLKQVWDRFTKFQKNKILYDKFKSDYHGILHKDHIETYQKTTLHHSLLDEDDDLESMIFNQNDDNLMDICKF